MKNNLIDIPPYYEEKLKLDSDLHNAILGLIGKTQDKLLQERPYFFPDYTFHGVKHVNTILSLSEKLMTDNSKQQLSPTGIFLLISAIITHDIGMFIEFDEFNELICGKAKHRKTKWLDSSNWQQLWDEYTNEIYQYSPDEVYKHFGDKVTIDKMPDLTKKITFSEFDKRICGEFIRKYHHRLSHEIVYYGFLREKKPDLFGDVVRNEFRHLIGLIGRSHGIAILETDLFLEKEFGQFIKYEPFEGVPVFYLMAVLRVCDYLDAGKHRAPHSVYYSQNIPSAISEFHWIVNQAIDINDFKWKSTLKTLHIMAIPESTSQYNYLKGWINSVQKEINDSKLLINRCYEPSKSWNFSIHTIEGLDNPEKYVDDFLTEPAKVRINPDIISLLVAPLYDYNPSCGLRELIQNATDACRERKREEEKRGNDKYMGQVKIKISTTDSYMEICDNGVGMSKETLIKYYLTVGASYRKSKDWAKNYTEDGKKSIVPRTGKFGVGVLASFLLGDHVSVKTKNIDDEFGCSFAFGLDDTIIDVTRDKNIDIGTTVRINLSEEILEQIVARQTIYTEGRFSRIVNGSLKKIKNDISSYPGFKSSGSPNLNFSALNDKMLKKGSTKYFIPFVWYLGADPMLSFEIDDHIESTPITLPSKEEYLSGWFSVNNTPFSKYLWSYTNPLKDLTKAYIGDNDFYEGYDPLRGLIAEPDWHRRHERDKHPLIYNGIIVPNATIQDEKSKYSIDFEIPILSLTDLDSEKSKFTIALNRNSCVFPNLDLLYCEQIKYLFAALLTCPYNVLRYGFANIPGLYKVDFIFFKNGFISHHKPLLQILTLKKIYGIVADVKKIREYCSENACVKLSKKDIEEIDKLGNVDWHGFKRDWDIDHYDLERNNMRTNWESIKKGTSRTKLSLSDIPETFQNLSNLRLVEFLLVQNSKHNEDENEKIFGERFDDIYKPEEVAAMRNKGIIDEYLLQFIHDVLNNDVLIPYSIPDRKLKYKTAFTLLEKYIEYWEEKWKNYDPKDKD